MNQEQQDAAKKEKRKKGALGFFLVLIPIICILLIIWLWPTIDTGKVDSANRTQNVEPGKKKAPTAGEIKENVEGKQPETQTEQNNKKGNENGKGNEDGKKYQWSEKTNLIFKCTIPFELRMILLVLLAGALGSYIHMATSFSYFIGVKKFEMTWYWWYWLRLPIGAVLALIFSMLVQGGIFVIPASGSEANPVSVIGLAGLIGMFSRQAIEKLRDIFDTVFSSTEQEKRKQQDENNHNANNNNANNNNSDNEKPGNEDVNENEEGGKKPDKTGK